MKQTITDLTLINITIQQKKTLTLNVRRIGPYCWKTTKALI